MHHDTAVDHPCISCRNYSENLPLSFFELEDDQVLGALAGLCTGCEVR